MKIKFIFAFSLSIATMHYNAQVVDSIKTEKVTNDNYIKLIDGVISNFKKRSSDFKALNQKPPDEYNLQEYIATMDPNTGTIHNSNFVKLENDLKAGRYMPSKDLELFAGVAVKDGKATGTQWIERGPYKVSGRIRGIMFDPNDTTGKKVWAGGVSGGLWYNNDITSATSEWQLVDSFWNNTSVSTIVADPNNPKIFYVGTGEVETGDIAGLGIWRTTDGGLTWTNVFNTESGQSSNLKYGIYSVPVIKVLNNNGVSEVYAGVAGSYLGDASTFLGLNEAGLYKSTNGVNFTKLSSLNVPGYNIGYDIQDIEIGSDQSIWVSTRYSYYGLDSGGKIFKSTNNGTTFTKVYDVGRLTSRVMIEISETDPNKVYALLEGANNSEPLRMAKTTNGGSTWISTDVANSGITLPKPIDEDQPASDFTRGQAFYDLVIEVDPQNDEHLYVGGIDSYKSTDGGNTWSQYTKWSNNNQLYYANIPIVHADQHALAFNPKNPNQFILSNDGGIFLANNKNNLVGSTALQARNNKLNITQFYHGVLNPSASYGNEAMLLGAQDNGTQYLKGAAGANGFYNATEAYGGDGAYSEFSKDNKYYIASYVYNYHYIFKPSGMSALIAPASQGNGQFINPLVLDRNLDIAYSNANGFGGAIRLNRVSGLASSNFTRSTITIASAAQGVGISKMVVSPLTTTSTTIFIGMSSGVLYKVTNANTQAPVITKINTTFPGFISDIKVGATENELMLTVSNFNTVSVFYSTDGGVNWVNKEGNLPDIPVKAIFMNPHNNDEVILGTYYGVWGTFNFQSANPTWALYSSGLGKFKVNHFDYRASDDTVLAVTYGRGAFTTRIVNNTLDTGNVDLAISENSVYPNPTRGPINVKFDTKKQNLVDVEVFDMTGKKVFEKQNVKSDVEFYIGHLTKGNYVLKFSKNGTLIYSSTILKR